MTEPGTVAKSRWEFGGRNLPVAVAVGGALVAYAVCALIWFHWGFVLLVAGILTFGVWELGQAMIRKGANPALWPVLVGTPLLMMGSYAAADFKDDIIWALTVQIAGLGLMSIVAMGWRLRGGVEGFIRDTSASLMLIAYVPLLGGSLILMVADNDTPAARLATYMFCIVANDTGAWLFGSLFGKHKLAPQVSPSKSWEGLIGGVLAAAAMGIPMTVFTLHDSWWIGLLLGVTLALAGTVGDLVESAVKRDAGMKDMGRLFPGHGGAMDRLDSLLYAAPVAWLVMYLLV